MFKGENKNINISVSKNSPVNASLSLDGYKHSMVQIIALTIALKMKTVIVNPPIVSDTYVFIAIINELDYVFQAHAVTWLLYRVRNRAFHLSRQWCKR